MKTGALVVAALDFEVVAAGESLEGDNLELDTVRNASTGSSGLGVAGGSLESVTLMLDASSSRTEFAGAGTVGAAG